jgi:cellulose biosynthesis protein BcsQ
VFAENQAAQKHNCVRKVIREAAALGYRFCVLDMHPDFGPLERAALIAADEVIVPLMPDAFKKLREDEETEHPAFNRIAINGIDNRIKLHTANVSKMKAATGTVFTFYEIPVAPLFQNRSGCGTDDSGT